MPYYQLWVSTRCAEGRFLAGRAGGFDPKFGKPSHQGTVALGGIVANLGLTTYSIRSITFKEADHHPGTHVDNCVEKLLVRNNKSNIKQTLRHFLYSLWITDNVT